VVVAAVAGQDQVLALRMQAAEGAVLLGPPAGEQERNQGDAEAVFKQLDDVGRLPEATSLNRATQSLAGLLPEGLKQPVQTELQQSLTWGDAPGTVKTARQTLFEVGAFYWTVPAPDIVNSGREEQGSVSV